MDQREIQQEMLQAVYLVQFLLPLFCQVLVVIQNSAFQTAAHDQRLLAAALTGLHKAGQGDVVLPTVAFQLVGVQNAV